MGQGKRGPLADAFEKIVWLILDAIPSKVHRAPLSHAAVAAGVAFDKMRLLRGEPTSITDDHGDLTARVLASPEARLAACRLLESIGAGADDPGRAGMDPQQGPPTQPASPQPSQPEATGRGGGGLPPPDDFHAPPPRQE